MTSLREQKKAETRDSLAREAARLVFFDGLSAATISAIAEKAHVSPRTFHNYFPSVEAALDHFTTAQTQRYSAVAIEKIRGGMSILDAVEYVVLEQPQLSEDPVDSYQAAVTVSVQIASAHSFCALTEDNMMVQALEAALPGFKATAEDATMLGIIAYTIAMAVHGLNSKYRGQDMVDALRDEYTRIFSTLRKGANAMPQLSQPLNI
ncbi:MAG: TetR/AcrR family transcriptional regulator [Corynebacterium sp.]|nr:TetR/AcrR family transcriptional regulator [Corynebacterium sp.]